MKLILAALLTLLLTGCFEQTGRYQMASAGAASDAVWKMDTATGDVSICIRSAPDGVIKCYLWGK